MAATKNVLEMSKVNTIGQNPFFSASSALNNPLFMNMSINPLSLPAISGLNFPGSAMFFSSNGSSKGNESPYSSQRTMDQSLNLSQSSLEDQDCDDDIESSMMGENGKRILGHRNQKRPIPNEQKDGKYFERRRRNNLAAKKSRDARKTREDQLAMRVAHLEKENAIFRAQVAILREEMSVLQLYLCQKANGNFKSETND